MSELWTECPNLGHTTLYGLHLDPKCRDVSQNSEPGVVTTFGCINLTFIKVLIPPELIESVGEEYQVVRGEGNIMT